MRILRTMTAVGLLLLALAMLPSVCQAAEKPLTEKEKIEALLKNVENLKDATFIRNAASYDAKTAARFLRGKWEARDKEIKTANDFIEKAATISSTSGKPYLIRFKDGHEIKCGDYLKGELSKIEKPPGENDKPPVR